MKLAAWAFVAILAVAPAANADEPSKFRDEEGAFDLSNYLLRHRGVLPAPIIVTEPAVGYGGGIALAYFSQSFEQRAEESRAKGIAVTPPDITMAAGGKTENGTWALGLGHMGFWDEDRWRYTGGLGKAELQLDYYSVGGEANAYRIDVLGLVQQMLRRVPRSNWFVGGRYVYVATESRFARERPGDVPPRQLDSALGKLGLVVDYDTRDNIFTPNRGTFFEAEAAFSRGAFGSDSQYETLYARAYSWFPAGQWVLGVRGDAQLTRGDVPFYAQPFITLRGVPAARYQDSRALVLEGEARYNVTDRWAAVGFAGVGKSFGRRQSWSEAKAVTAGGVGFRYLVARKLGMYAGLDVARGPEDAAVYIQMGSAWR